VSVSSSLLVLGRLGRYGSLDTLDYNSRFDEFLIPGYLAQIPGSRYYGNSLARAGFASPFVQTNRGCVGKIDKFPGSTGIAPTPIETTQRSFATME
jgi:hypothetical protein